MLFALGNTIVATEPPPLNGPRRHRRGRAPFPTAGDHDVTNDDNNALPKGAASDGPHTYTSKINLVAEVHGTLRQICLDKNPDTATVKDVLWELQLIRPATQVTAMNRYGIFESIPLALEDAPVPLTSDVALRKWVNICFVRSESTQQQGAKQKTNRTHTNK